MTDYRAIGDAPDAEALYATLKTHLADHVAARGARPTRVVGIHSGGTWVGERLHDELGLPGRAGALDISFYRDDFNRIGLHGQVKPTDLDFDVDGADILLVDDVLYSGRTIRGALNVLFDFGRPARVDLAVLIDRETPEGDARELPFAARWSGARLSLPREREFVLSRDAGRFAFSVASTPRPLPRTPRA
jgi:pyrimidine operon attenuation protein/uracil phosphoribosyltransferase